MNDTTPTNDLPLSIRTRNTLLKAGLTTWAEVKGAQLDDVPGLGARGLIAINELWAAELNEQAAVEMSEKDMAVIDDWASKIKVGPPRHQVASMIDHAMRGGLESLTDRRSPAEVDAVHKRQFMAAAEKEVTRSLAMAGTGSFGDPTLSHDELERRKTAFTAHGGSVVTENGRALLALRLEADIQARISALIPVIKELPHVKELGVDVSAETVGRMALIRGLDMLEKAHGGAKKGENSAKTTENRAETAEKSEPALPTGDEEVLPTPEGWTRVGEGEKIPVPEAVLHDYYTQNGWYRYWGRVDDQVIYFYWSPERRHHGLSAFPGTDKGGRRVAVQETPWGPGHVVPSNWANT